MVMSLHHCGAVGGGTAGCERGHHHHHCRCHDGTDGWWGGIIVVVVINTDGLLLSRIECSGSCMGCCREWWWWCSENNLAIRRQSLILNLYYKTWSIKWLNRGCWCQCVGYIIQYILHYMEVKATQVLCKLVFYQTSSPMDRYSKSWELSR